MNRSRTHGRPRWRRAVVACVLFCALAGCDSRQELTRVDSEKEANRILVEIEARGVSNATKEEKTAQRKTAWSITVPPDELSLARAILVQCDLPRDTHSGFSELAASSALIPTKGEERAKLIYATSGELARTFETYDRVISARVHIVVPEQEIFSHEAATRPSATSAMVLIKYTPLPAPADGKPRPAVAGFADAPVSADEVKQMVARSVEGLATDNVYVSFTRSVSTPQRIPPTVAAATSAPAKTGATESTSTPADKSLLMQLFGATVLFGLIAIVLTALLVREKRRQRLMASHA
ncbi:MAG TPA: hypothetical protein VIM11_07080 [Tepidisphaeraceae bacterium]